MPVMKGLMKAAVSAAVLALCACTHRHTPAPEPGQVAAPATTADAEAAAAEQAAKDAQALERESSTIIGRFFSRLFGSTGKRQDATDAPATQPGDGQVLPSPAQEEAALRLLAEQGGDDIPDPADGGLAARDISVQGIQTGPLTIGLPQFGSDSAGGMGVTTLGNGSVLKAAPGLRIRNLAPPEEAVSTGGSTDAPKPNSAEMKGLRPIPLPESLPMDINGKLTKEKP